MRDDAGNGGSDVAETHADGALLDHSELVARCMGNVEFAAKILDRFQQQLDDDLALLENECNQHDAAGIARVAHRLKGASANVSARGLRDIFARLEQLGRTEQLRQVPACMDELRSQWSRFKSQSPTCLLAGGRAESTIAVDGS